MIISVKEVFTELDKNANTDFLRDWIKKNKSIFFKANQNETLFVSEIFKVKHFQNIISKEALLKGTPTADPFVIAAAKVKKCCVVTNEKDKPNAAKIPNICEHFQIDCLNLEEFMKRENWSF